MTIYQILCVIGVPSLVSICGYFYHSLKKIQKKNMAVELGVQALLRGQMISDYNHWMDRNYAPIYARENFENCWIRYHDLGADGVMDDIHNKFMALPTEKPE